MFTVLLESRARQVRRTGGTVLSAAVHLTLIASAAAATAHGRAAAPHSIEVVPVTFRPPPVARTSVDRTEAVRSAVSSTMVAPRPVVHVAVPTTISTALPSIDVGRGVPSDSVVLGGGVPSGTGARGTLDLSDGGDANRELRGQDLLIRLLTSSPPRYPESLRQSGIDGHVLVRFVVDTMGHVDMASVQVVQSTHNLFTRSVREALSSLRFRPMEAQGKRVRSLAEMPFEFAIRR